MVEEDMRKLGDPQQTLTHKLLRALSGLDRAGLAAAQQGWTAIADVRRRQIAAALVEMAEDDADMDFVDVFRFLLADKDAVVRASAVAGLWETDDQSFADPVISLLRTDPAPQVREAAAEILGHFGMLALERQARSARGKRILAALLETFHSTEPLNTVEVRRNALESAAFFSDDADVFAAIRQAYGDANLTMRSAAVSAMGISFEAEWDEVVLKELESAEPEMRFVAARAAGDLWLQEAVPRLVAMTKDPDPEVQLMAITALGEVGGIQAKATLTELLESHDEGIRDAAEEALDDLRLNENPLDFGGVFGGAKKSKGKKEE